jgi:hypothetical protein
MCRSLALKCLIKTGRSRVIACHSRAIGSLIMGNLFIAFVSHGKIGTGWE